MSRRPLRMKAGESVVEFQDAQDAGRGSGPAGALGAARGSVGDGAGQVVQVGAFGVVELQGARDGVQDFFGGSGEVAALQADVVVDADAGEQLLTAQAGHAPGAAVGGQAGLLGGDLGAAGGQELADVALGAHAPQVRSGSARLGGPVSTCDARPSLEALACGFLDIGSSLRPRFNQRDVLWRLPEGRPRHSVVVTGSSLDQGAIPWRSSPPAGAGRHRAQARGGHQRDPVR